MKETSPAAVRAAIKRQLPDLKFRVRRVSFQDLARAERLFVFSDAWGMTKGNHETYRQVQGICEQFPDVIVSW